MAETDEDLDERIVDVDVSAEMETSFLEYAYSVIYARALPDARDGLKPVQRRILYSMNDMGIRPDKPHVKCARVVGQVMGLLHPHGDSAIYDALVRLAQSWSMRLPLVSGHGNFGSADSGPAAMRYTECRMAPAAQAMTEGLDEDTVDFKPNYDGKEKEPVVLPAAFPNLLVNGSTGIAVGMATNIAPHNLVECIKALKHLLAHPDATLTDLMRYIPGPDLPTGGTIIGLDGIRDAYETGRGAFRIRATAHIEQVTARRRGIVITELPFGIGPEKIIEQIKLLVQKNKISGITDVKDLTDLVNGLKLVIDVKNGFNAEVLLEQLYRLTKLEDSFSINAVALVDGQPRTMSLPDMLTVYLNHRLEVTLRRTRYRLAKATDRLHLVDGLLLAIVDIDKVVAIVRSSADATEARNRLIEAFDLSEVQANYILDMQLRRLTKYSRIELESERNELRQTIADLTRIIENDAALRAVVAAELDDVAKAYGTPRRTVLMSTSGIAATSAAAAPLEVGDDPCWVMLSSTGLLGRWDTDDPLPVTGSRTSHDVLTSAIKTTARGYFGLITNTGRIIRANAIDLPSLPPTATAPNLKAGSAALELFPLDKNERLLALTTLTEQTYGWALGTAKGIVKRVNPEMLANKDSWDIIRLDDSDEVVGAVELTDDTVDLVFVTSQASLLRFPAASVRPQGRSGGGIAGIKLPDEATVVFFGAAGTSAMVATVAGTTTALPGTGTGSVKVTPLSEYPGKGRATGGVRCHRFLRDEDCLRLAWVGPAPVVAATATGSPIVLPAPSLRRDGPGLEAKKTIAAIGTRRHGAASVDGPEKAGSAAAVVEASAVRDEPDASIGEAVDDGFGPLNEDSPASEQDDEDSYLF